MWDQHQAIEAISEAVVHPLQTPLEEANITQITIIPDGPLHSLPFAALKLPGQNHPLIAKYSISYSPSLATRAAIEDRAESKTSEIPKKTPKIFLLSIFPFFRGLVRI